MKKLLFLLFLPALLHAQFKADSVLTSDVPNVFRQKVNRNFARTQDSLAAHRAKIDSLVSGTIDQTARDSITEHRAAIDGKLDSTVLDDTLKVATNASIQATSRSGGTEFAHSEIYPRLRVQKGITIMPDSGGSGYSNLNLSVGYNPRGMGLINWLSQAPDGTWKTHLTMGSDKVQNRVGADSLPPVFIPLGVYDTNNVVNDLASAVVEDYVQPGVGNRYRGEWGFGLAPPLIGSAFSVGSQDYYVSSNSIMSIFRSTEDSTNKYLELKHGPGGYVTFDINSMGGMRWYGTSSNHSPYTGDGWEITDMSSNTAINKPKFNAGAF